MLVFSSRAYFACCFLCPTQAPYLLCYALAGTELQFAVLPAAPREQDVVRLGPVLRLHKPVDRLKAVHVILRMFSVLVAFNKMLPPTTAPIGHVQRHGDATTITYHVPYVTKEVDVSELPTFDASPAGIQRLQDVYAATKGCPHIIQAHSSLHFNQSSHKYSISLTPVGRSLTTSEAPIKAELQDAVRCVLSFACTT
jgi:hypothetical protein